MTIEKESVMKISRESALLAILCTADMISTLWLVASGRAVEANPLLAFYLNIGYTWFALVKCLLYLAPIYLLELLRPRRPRFVHILLRIGIMLYLFSYGAGVWWVNVRGGSASSPQHEASGRTTAI